MSENRFIKNTLWLQNLRQLKNFFFALHLSNIIGVVAEMLSLIAEQMASHENDFKNSNITQDRVSLITGSDYDHTDRKNFLGDHGYRESKQDVLTEKEACLLNILLVQGSM